MVNLIFIHGVSVQTTGYSNTFYRNILKFYKEKLFKNKLAKKETEAKAQELVQKEILWADTTTDLTERYLTLQFGLNKRPGKWNLIAKSVDPLVIQIMFYVKDKGDKKTIKKGHMSILKEIENAFKKACSNKPEKTVIIAHSLGSVIAFDYVFGFRKYRLDPKINVEALITLGSPIPMFTSAMGYVESKVKLPANIRRWINILDPDDGVARYCKRYFKNIKVEDIEVNTGWLPLSSHANYWRDKEVAELIADKLIEWKV